ncbi:MAG TPA: hypothetical protein VF917_01810, partial [Steroidobacteraceae bacterium]
MQHLSVRHISLSLLLSLAFLGACSKQQPAADAAKAAPDEKSTAADKKGAATDEKGAAGEKDEKEKGGAAE